MCQEFLNSHLPVAATAMAAQHPEPRTRVHVEALRSRPAGGATQILSNKDLSKRLYELISTFAIIEDGPLHANKLEKVKGLSAEFDSVRICGLADRCLRSVDDRDDFEELGKERGAEGSTNQHGVFNSQSRPSSRYSTSRLPFWKVDLVVHVYSCCEDGTLEELDSHPIPESDVCATEEDIQESEDEEPRGDDMFDNSTGSKLPTAGQPIPANPLYSALALPSRTLVGAWESLVLEPGIKSFLLNYVRSGVLLSSSGIDTNLISWNRIALLHGPPGSGKTTLCRALAQKLAIHLNCNARLLSIHANALFSKWFSESSRNVHKLFTQIQRLAQTKTLLIVHIDEIESLSASRAAAASGAEPSDALRVVNALLTSLDELRTFSNVLILATSNLPGSLDCAFLDRADIKLRLPSPSLHARYMILLSSVSELVRVGIVRLPTKSSFIAGFGDISLDDTGKRGEGLEDLLQRAAQAAEGMSGRGLRKLCVIAHAETGAGKDIEMISFLQALRRAALRELR